MTAASDYDTDILDTLARGVVVGDGAMGTQLQAANLTLDDFSNRRGRGRDEIRSAAIEVELGVHTSGDDVDFSGREALQRTFWGAWALPGIRHARQSKGRLPLRKERT